MRRPVLILAAVLVLATSAYWWRGNDVRSPRDPDFAADIAALRLQATDLQRSVETLARSPDPDAAELAALAERLEMLNRSLARIEGHAGD
jgi:uncharacterized protein YlxW (UPF0749 family)